MQAQHFTGGLRKLLEFRRRAPVRIGRREYPHLAVFAAAQPFAVAASGGLSERVETALGTQYLRKIDVDAGLDQRCRDQAARLAFFETAADLLKFAAAMPCAHQRAEMARAGQAGDGLIQGPRMAAIVDDA